MKKLILLGAIALFSSPITAVLAVPMCDGPDLEQRDSRGRLVTDEQALAQTYELQLRGQGIDANNTRFWNGCLQTFVSENGHTVMKFYDPNSLQEVPVN